MSSRTDEKKIVEKKKRPLNQPLLTVNSYCWAFYLLPLDYLSMFLAYYYATFKNVRNKKKQP